MVKGKSRPRAGPGPAARVPGDPGQYQRFLETARKLGLDPAGETDLARLDPVVRRMGAMPPERQGPMRDAEEPGEERDGGVAGG